MAMELAGALAARGEAPLTGYCPIERVVGLLTSRSALLVLRETFYGATRFEEVVARTGLTEAATATRLRAFVDAGILGRRPYRVAGQRPREEYVLTASGEALMPVVLGLLQWGNAHDPPPYPPSLHHTGCGEPVDVVATCAAGHRVGADEVTVTAAGPFGLDDEVSG